MHLLIRGFFFLIITALANGLNAQDYAWVKFFQGQYQQLPVCMTVDEDGNQYAAFNNSSEIIIDSQTVSAKALLIKQDSSGKTLWYNSLSAPQYGFVYILSTNFTSSGNLLCLVGASTDILFGQDTLVGLRSNNTNRNIFVLEFGTSGQLIRSACILHAYFGTPDYSGNGTHSRIEMDDQGNLYACFGHRDTVIIIDTSGQQTKITGNLRNSVFKFSGAGQKFEWMTELPAGASKSITDLDVDQNGLVYIASRFYYTPATDSTILKNAGFDITVLSSHTNEYLGIVFVLDNGGVGKNWIRFRSSIQCTIQNIAAYDSNSVFVSGLLRGDSIHSPATSLPLPVSGTFHFYGLYSSSGQERWLRHEDTSTSQLYIFNNQHGTITHFENEYYYISYRSAHHYNQPVKYSGQSYPVPSNWSYAYGVTLKIDSRGDVLWCLRSQESPFQGLGTDNQSNLYFQGYWSYDTVRFGSFSAPISHSLDGYIGKTFDYGIFRGDVSEGPYCAGDTFIIPYSLHGTYGDSNTFIAELSDENGNFTGKERELGRLQTKNADTIRGLLPLFQVASSGNYRIRIRSTHPQVQSFYRSDTLRLLVYSRDKADPGPTDTICLGDTLLLNTYGGTKWTWSPAYRMSDSSLRQPLVWPDSNRIYQIIIDDSSGCGQADTAYKSVVVREKLDLQSPVSSLSLCPIDTVYLPVNASGGNSISYHIAWYKDTVASTGLLNHRNLSGSQDSFSVSGISGDTSGTRYFAVLGDSCSYLRDTLAFLVKSYLPLQIEIPLNDTTLCRNSPLLIRTSTQGGGPHPISYSWKQNGNYLDSGSSLQLNPALNNSGTIRVLADDGCSLAADSAEMQLGYFDALQADIAHQSRLLTDTSLCPGTSVYLNNFHQFNQAGTDTVSWYLAGRMISDRRNILFSNDSIRQAWMIPSDSLLAAYLLLEYQNQCEVQRDSIWVRLLPQAVNAFDNAAVSVEDTGIFKLHFRKQNLPNVLQYKVYRESGSQSVLLDSFLFSTSFDTYSYKDTTSIPVPCYRIETLDSCGNSQFSNSFCPQDLTGTPEQLQNTLRWQLDSSYSAQAVWLWNGMQWDSLSGLLPNDTTWIHSMLACNSGYLYRISFTSPDSERHFSSTIHLLPFDTVAPQAPAWLDISVNNQQKLTLSWPRSVDSDVSNYEIWKDNGNGFILLQANYPDTLFTDLLVNADSVPPSYFIIAKDSCGNGNRSEASDSTAHFRISLETGDCDPLIHIQWESYAGIRNETPHYAIWRSIDGINYSRIDSGNYPGRQYTDTSVLENQYYTYRIEAFNSSRSVFTDTAAMVPFVFPVPSMSKIYDVSVVSSGSNGEVKLNWMEWDMNDTFARGYYLWDQSSGTPFLLHTETDLHTTMYSHTPIDLSNAPRRYILTTYNLCLDSGNLYRQSLPSNPHQSIHLEIENRNLEAKLDWSHYVGFTIGSYEIWRREDNGVEVLHATINGTDSSYQDFSLRCGHDYSYRIKANEVLGNHSSWSNEVLLQAFDTVPPSAVRILNAGISQTGITNGEVQMEIESSTENNAFQIRIYHKDASGTEVLFDSLFNQSGQVLSYSHPNLNTENAPHHYRVQLSDSCGNASLYSQEFSTVHLNSLAVNNAIQLSWTKHRGFDNWRYHLERQNPDGSWTLLADLDTATRNYTDSMVRCLSTYTYRIRCIDLNSTFVSLSNLKMDSAFSNDLPEIPEIRQVSVVANNSIEIQWINAIPQAQRFILERSTDSMTWMEVFSGLQTSYNDNTVNTETQAYYYRLIVEDSCLNRSGRYSPSHRNIHLELQAVNEGIDLNWSPYLRWTPSYYRIYRNGLLLDSVPATQLTYSDTHLHCTQVYQYQIEAVSGTGLFSLSNAADDRPLDTNPPTVPQIEYISTTTPNKEAELSWLLNTDFDLAGYEILRHPGNQSVEMIYDNQLTSYLLPIRSEASNCYVLRSFDSCGNFSTSSAPVCLIANNATALNGENAIQWEPYSYFLDGLSHYEIYVSEDSINWLYVDRVNASSLYYLHSNPDTVQSRFVYQVRAYSAGPQTYESRSLVSTVVQAQIVWIPTSFTPSGSLGLNDLFKPEGAWIAEFEIQVYNRWGQMVFRGAPNEGWDGVYMEAPLTEGVYMYTMRITGSNGETKHYKGTVTLLYP